MMAATRYTGDTSYEDILATLIEEDSSMFVFSKFAWDKVKKLFRIFIWSFLQHKQLHMLPWAHVYSTSTST